MDWGHAVTFFYLLLRVSGLSVPGEFQCGVPLIQPVSLSSDKDTAVGKRIIGGKEAKPGSWPWMVMLKKSDRVKCGGSILSKELILTAAHCLQGEKDLTKWKVYVGKHHKDRTDITERVHTIKRVIPHEKFDIKTLNNDIALLILKEPLRFTEYVSPICLPPRTMLDDSTCFSTGWGETKGTGHDDVLKEVRLQRKLPILCARFLYTIGRSSLRNVFCAGRLNADACYGDSGGPYSCKSRGRWYIKGVVSSGADCGQPGWPGIYINVQRYLKWIRGKMLMLKTS